MLHGPWEQIRQRLRHSGNLASQTKSQSGRRLRQFFVNRRRFLVEAGSKRRVSRVSRYPPNETRPAEIRSGYLGIAADDPRAAAVSRLAHVAALGAL